MYNEQQIQDCVDTLKRELNIITESQEHRGLLLDAVEIIEQLQSSNKDNLFRYVELQQSYVTFVKVQNDKLSTIVSGLLEQQSTQCSE